MDNFCEDHGSCETRITHLECRLGKHDKKIDTINTKLNFIIGGVIVSPFIVAVLTLLTKFK